MPAKAKTTNKKKVGRPTKYSNALADQILERVSQGVSLVKICSDETMPNRATVYKWFKAHPEFNDNYTRAREEQADFYADQIIEIADTAEDAAIAKLQIDARKWVASKLKGRSYGDKVSVGGDKENPIKLEINAQADEAERKLNQIITAGSGEAVEE